MLGLSPAQNKHSNEDYWFGPASDFPSSCPRSDAYDERLGWLLLHPSLLRSAKRQVDCCSIPR